MLHSKFQAPESSDSGKDCSVYFIFEPKSPRQGAILDPGHHLKNKLNDSVIRQCFIPNIKTLGLTVLEKMLKQIVDNTRRTTHDS